MLKHSFNAPERGKTSVEKMAETAVNSLRHVRNGLREQEERNSALKLSEEESNLGLQEEIQQHRGDLAETLKDTSVVDEALALFDRYVSDENYRDDEAREDMKKLIMNSSDYHNEVAEYEESSMRGFEQTSADLSAFLESKVAEHINNLAERTKWGYAKLDFEKGEPAQLISVLTEYQSGLREDEEKTVVADFITMLKHYKKS